MPMRAGPHLWLFRILAHGLLPIAVPALWLQGRLRGKSRPPLSQRMAWRLPCPEPGGVWLQAVSVGEVELARRLVSELERRAPQLPLLVTATTATGLDLARRTLGQRLPVHACPIDLPGAVSRVLDGARPRVVVLVETELWPELLHQSARRGIPVMVVNGRLSEDAFQRYRRIRALLRPLLQPVTRVLARSDEDARRFAHLGVAEERIRVAGNIVAPSQIGSIEYAAKQFGTHLVVVLGHSNCGAVIATLDELALRESHRSPNLRAIVDRVRPAVEPVLEDNKDLADDEILNMAVRANVHASVEKLQHGSLIIEDLIEKNELQIIGAEYSIEDGTVEFLDV